jgi:hypothetical protein
MDHIETFNFWRHARRERVNSNDFPPPLPLRPPRATHRRHPPLVAVVRVPAVPLCLRWGDCEMTTAILLATLAHMHAQILLLRAENKINVEQEIALLKMEANARTAVELVK